MITINKHRYWEQLINYYYDNIHWAESDIKPTSTLSDWLFKEYGAETCDDGHSIRFTDAKKYTHFILRWS